jgi:hypothetical protein
MRSSILRWCTGIGSTGVVLVFSSMACSVPVEGAGSGSPTPSSSESTIVGGFEVNVLRSGETMSATVADPTGKPVYSYEGLYTLDDLPVIKYTLPDGTTGYHVFPESTIPSSDYFAKAAYYDYIGTSRAASAEASYDLQGCDGFPASTSCTSVGSCCDTHDACYAQNNCSAASWLYTGVLTALVSKCAACNTAVVGCFATGGSGPAACCSTGTCKQPWGTPGGDGQCICQGKPNSCKSAACTGSDAGADSGAKDSGSDSASKDSGSDAKSDSSSDAGKDAADAGDSGDAGDASDAQDEGGDADNADAEGDDGGGGDGGGADDGGGGGDDGGGTTCDNTGTAAPSP